MQTYQWNAIDYAKSSSVQQQWARELIRKLDLKGNESLLDIGCGDGKITAEIASYLPNGSVIGIDSSEEMILLAQSQFSINAFPHLHFQEGDARSLSFQNKFDIVFSNATLHWVLDHRLVLHGIYSSLKRGGKVLLQMGGKGNAAEVLTAFDKLAESKEWHNYFNGFDFPYGFYGPDEYRQWLCEVGFHVNRVELIPKDMAHQGRSDFEAWIRTTWLPYTQRVPKEKQNTFISQLANVYTENHPPDESGKIHINMVRLEVEAAKL
jgi:trans-aconitate 2-methyltransferase